MSPIRDVGVAKIEFNSNAATATSHAQTQGLGTMRAPCGGMKKYRRRFGHWLVAAGLALIGPARIATLAVPLQGCGGCLDASRAKNLVVTPAESCLQLKVAGLCYGAGLAGTNSCADPLVIDADSVAPGQPISLEPTWTIDTDSGAFSSTDHYSLDAKLGTTPIKITFDY